MTTQRIIIFGATAGTGRQLLTQALSEGHEVTAFARTPAKLADLAHPRLTVVPGDVTDASAVASAVAGHDAVFVALGSGAMNKDGIRERGTRHIVDAMEASGVRRLVCLSVLGANETRKSLPWFLKYLIFPLYLRRAVADHEAQEQVVWNSQLDWTIVRPPTLTDGEAEGGFYVGDFLTPPERKLSLKISRADVARFMLDVVGEARWFGASPAISN